MKHLFRLLLAILSLGVAGSVHAQSTAQSKDYWVSYPPSLDSIAPNWLLMATNAPGTQVWVHYLDDNVTEQYKLEPNKPMEYRIRASNNGNLKYLLAKPTVPEVPQRRSIHITSSNPISLQGFTDADNNVGLFLILPTSNLGQKYTISAFNDQHSRMSDGGGIGGWSPAAFPRTGGEFIIVATEDNTIATVRVTGPTRGGRKSGEVFSVNLNKGETYWVLGAGESEDDDLSRSTVTSNKPVAVFAGAEIMRAYDAMVLQDHFDYNDYIVEQLIPQEVWGTEYVSAPFTNKRGTAPDVKQWGDLYRVYAAEPTRLWVNGQDRGVSDYWEFPLIGNAMHFVSEKPVQVVQYDYYVDFHVSGDIPRTSNSEMVLVPRHNWRKNATFTIPTGYQQTFFHVVAHRDSIDKIKASINGRPPAPISAMKFGKAFVYNIGDYRVYTIMLNEKGQVLVQGPCDFAVYNYGTRDNDQIKATYGYASAAAASFGSISKAIPPRMAMDSTCTEFNLKFWNTSADARGIADIFLLEDPQGLIYRGKPFVSYNVNLDVERYVFGADTVFAKVTVRNPLLDAYAAVYVVNKAGKDTVYTFTYSGPNVTAAPKLDSMLKTLVFTKDCREYTFKNEGKKDVLVTNVLLKSATQGKASPFSIEAGALPRTLKPGESMKIRACFVAPDTIRSNIHYDSIMVETGCFKVVVAAVMGSGAAPVIYAEDHDFLEVNVGRTKCADIRITNESTDEPLILTRDIIGTHPEFKISDASLAGFPDTLQPGESRLVEICYTPLNEGADTLIITWGRLMPSPYDINNRKEWTVLTGFATAPGVGLDGATETVICEGTPLLTALLSNTGDAQASISSLTVEAKPGAIDDAAEFRVESINNGPIGFPFGLSENSSVKVQVRFTANLADPSVWRTHEAVLKVTYAGATEPKTALLKVDLYRAVLSSPGTVDFGTSALNDPRSRSFEIENTGNTDFIVKDWTVSNPVFTLVSGIAVGQVIKPNEKITVVVQATAADANTYTGDLTINGTTLCGQIIKPMTYTTRKFEVTAQGADVPETWTCESNDDHVVRFINNSSDDVRLRGVEILSGDPSAVNASQIEFGTQTVGTVMPGGTVITFPGGQVLVPANTTMEFPVVFNSNIVGPAQVPVQFTYLDTIGISQVINVDVTGIGKHYPIDLSMATSVPSAVNDKEVEVPIKVAQTNLAASDLYGFEFDLTFNEDMFYTWNVKEGGQGQLVPTIVNGPVRQMINGVNYATLTIRAHSATDRLRDGQNQLAIVNLMTALTLEDTTSFWPSNLKFLRQDGSAACYVPTTQIGTAFTYDPLCGDKSLAGYMDRGANFLRDQGVMPNPAKDASILKFGLGANDALVTVEIFDALGQKVKTVMTGESLKAGKHEIKLDLSTLPSGVYYARVDATTPVTHSVNSTPFTVNK